MSHITSEQRYTISVLKAQNLKQCEIAKIIGKDNSVVSRELKRNKDLRSGEYRSDLAQRKYEQRQGYKSKPRNTTEGMLKDIKELIEKDYSPEQVVGELKKEGKKCVSHETIYQLIWADKKQKGDLHEHLRRKGRKYRKGASRNPEAATLSWEDPLSDFGRGSEETNKGRSRSQLTSVSQ